MVLRSNVSRQIVSSSSKVKYFTFTGGLNIVDAALSLQPGECIAGTNFECDVRGRYRRVDGYERFDGQPLPSEIVYYRVRFSAGTKLFGAFAADFGEDFNNQIPSVGDMVKGATSGAVGKILLVDVTYFFPGGAQEGEGDPPPEGTFQDSDAEGYVYFTLVSGTFDSSETIYFLNANSSFGVDFNVEFS